MGTEDVSIHPSAIVEEGASIGRGSSVGAFSIIHGNASLGENSSVDSHCVLGHTEPGTQPAPLIVGDNARIRSHTILYGGTTFADGLETGNRVTIRENASIGTNFRVGTLSDIQGHCSIGDYVRFHSNVHIGQGSLIGDFVWIFPYVVLTNDPHPPSEGFLRGVVVEDFAVIATMSVILPGLTIGRESLVGAGAVISRDVRPGTVAVGVPGRELGATDKIMLSDASGPAYPWRRHFHRGYPDSVTAQWRGEFET